MNLRSFVATVAEVTVGALLLTATIMPPSEAARAAPASKVFYVAPPPIGSDHALSSRVPNSCRLQVRPCATIGQAIAEEAASAQGSSEANVISLAKGVYDDPDDSMFSALGTANDELTITGAGPGTQVVPATCSALSRTTSGPDASLATGVSESAIVNLDGLHGVTLKDMTVSGAGAIRAGCDSNDGYRAAVLSTGAGTQNALDDVFISSGTEFGVQMDDNSQTSLSGVELEPELCTTTMKGPRAGLEAGWNYPQDLAVSKTPKCAVGFTSVVIDGVSFAAASKGSKTIVLTGGPKPPATPSIPRGSTVTFNTSVAAYTSVGIACNTLTEPLPARTSCSVSSTTVTGGGTVYTSSGSPVGILVTNGASANLDGDKVAGNTDATDNGIGIGLLPDTADGETAGPTTVGHDVSADAGTGNTVVGNDISILASAFPGVSSSALWGIDGNIVSGDETGVLMSGLTTGTNVGGVAFSSNTVTNTLLGPGVELADDGGAGGGSLIVGGPTSQSGNTVSDNGIGIAVTEGTSAVTFQNNTIDGNLSFGVAVDGPDAMPEFLPGTTTANNTFVDNVWTGNGVPVSGTINGGANVIDFGGFAFPSASQSIGGAASAQATDLVLDDPIPGGTTPSSITLTKSAGVVQIGPGTLISISGYCAASTFTCVGSNVSFFVTSVGGSPTGDIGSIPVVVDVAPIAPTVAQALNAVPAGGTVTSNGQIALSTTNVYSGNSCTPASPNSSTTLKAGTGGGPAGPDGSVTGYDAC